jgi:hypothetical protein
VLKARKVLVIPADDYAALVNGPSEDLRVICLAHADLGNMDDIETSRLKLL